MKIINYILAIVAIIFLGMIALKSTPALLGGATYDPTFGSAGTTNAKVTVNTTSTQVVAGGYANIVVLSTSNASTSCFLDNATAASSSVAVGSGIIIPANSSRSFGALGDIPYAGNINCISTATTSLGVMTN